eukprot:scaffold876_cov243-Pinguiococcus_pyrenoidosus.AAC.51
MPASSSLSLHGAASAPGAAPSPPRPMSSLSPADPATHRRRCRRHLSPASPPSLSLLASRPVGCGCLPVRPVALLRGSARPALSCRLQSSPEGPPPSCASLPPWPSWRPRPGTLPGRLVRGTSRPRA